ANAPPGSPATWLTQKDVDAVFGTAAAAAAPEPYDFLASPRLPREQRTVLEGGLDRFATALSGLLTTRIRRPIEVTAVEPQTTTLGDFVPAPPAPCACFTFPFGASRAYADLGPVFSLFLVERLFGGAGETAQTARALTALERSALDGLTKRVPAMLGEG